MNMKLKLNDNLRYSLYAVLACVFLSSCNHLEDGIVIGKRYEEADRNLMLIPMRVGKVTIMQQYWIYDNEDWVITIEGEKDGKMIHEDVYVTKQCFEALNYGDTWIKTDDCSFSDDNNSKTKAD